MVQCDIDLMRVKYDENIEEDAYCKNILDFFFWIVFVISSSRIFEDKRVNTV